MLENIEGINYNGRNIADIFSGEGTYLVVNDVRGRGVLPSSHNLIDAPGYDGAYLSGVSTGVRVIEADITVKGESFEDLRKRIETLSEALYSEHPVPIIFSDEVDREYFGTLSDVAENGELSKIAKITITFLCPDPYKYGPEQTHAFATDTEIITNTGTAESDPIFELEVLAPVTFAMVQNDNEEYMMIGKPTDVDEEVVDTRTLLLEERGETLDAWSDKPTSVDGGVVAGNLSTDNDGITVPSYGSDTNKWHGPALIKEVTPAQDFEIEMMLQGRTSSPDQTFRVEFYLFDEGMNVLGKMAILDKSLGVNKKTAEGRLGTYDGIGNRYLISSQNYSYDQDFFYGMLRMRRVGSQIFYYVSRVNNNNKHVQSFGDMTYVDGDYLGKLKYIQIHIGKYGSTERAYAPKINHIKVFELSEEGMDQTPYIARPGDVITFDHKDDEILLNGEDATELKDFGANYFKLAKGYGQLVVHPANSFAANVKYRNKYR